MLPINKVGSSTYIIAPSATAQSIGPLINTINNSLYDLIILGNINRDLLTPNLLHSSSYPLSNKLIIGYVDVGASTGLVTTQYLKITNVNQLPVWFGKPEAGYLNTNPLYSLYTVQYWQNEWLSIIKAQIDDQIIAGYDGIFLDELTNYNYFKLGNEIGNLPNSNAYSDMVTVVKNIYLYIQSKNLNKPFYIIANNPAELINFDPSITKYFNGIFNEFLYWMQDPLDGKIAIPVDSSSVTLNNKYLINSYANLNMPVFANDYPPLNNSKEIILGLQNSVLNEWIPSVQNAFQSSAILSTGPNLAVATSNFQTLIGNSTNTNYLVAAKNVSPTMIGGSSTINYFILSDTKNIAEGGKSADYFYMHPIGTYQKNIFSINVSEGLKGKASDPNLSLKIDGITLLAPTKIATSNEIKNLSFEFDISRFTTIKNIQIIVENTSYKDQLNYSNIGINGISLNGSPLDLSLGIYSNGSFNKGNPYSNNGTVNFNSNNFLATLNTSFNQVDGKSGLNAAIYQTDSKYFKIINKYPDVNVTSENFSISDKLSNVQRIQFSDKALALDLDGGAGTTAKILGAVLGKESLLNKNYVGIGLSFLDSGWTYDNLAALALDAAGAKTNDQIVSLLWTNVIGSKPTAADKAPFIALLENGMTAGALAHLAADTSFNTTNINLVGLAHTGIEFIPIT